jgi:hypothetical protein
MQRRKIALEGGPHALLERDLERGQILEFGEIRVNAEPLNSKRGSTMIWNMSRN